MSAALHSRIDRVPVFSADQAFALLGIDRTTGYRAIKDGTFPVPTIKVGRLIRVPVAPLRALLHVDPDDADDADDVESEGGVDVGSYDDGLKFDGADVRVRRASRSSAALVDEPAVVAAEIGQGEQ